MDDALVLELEELVVDMRIFSIAPRIHQPGDVLFEYLIVVPLQRKPQVAAILARHGESLCDLVSAETFDRLGPPAYFHRCKPIPLVALATAASRRAVERARHAEAERHDLLALHVLVVSPRAEIASVIDEAVRAAFPTVKLETVTSAEDAVGAASNRTDCVVVDAALPDWGALRAVDWLQPLVPGECVGLLTSAEEHERTWKLLRGRGVHRVETDGSTLGPLLAAGRRRNHARARMRW